MEQIKSEIIACLNLFIGFILVIIRGRIGIAKGFLGKENSPDKKQEFSP